MGLFEENSGLKVFFFFLNIHFLIYILSSLRLAFFFFRFAAEGISVVRGYSVSVNCSGDSIVKMTN